MGIGRSRQQEEVWQAWETKEGRGEVWRSRESRGVSRLEGAKNCEGHQGGDWTFLLVGTGSAKLSM